MLRHYLFLLPAVLLCAADAPAPLNEVGPGIWVLKGVPGPEAYAEFKRHHVTFVMDFRRDEELGQDPNPESSELENLGIGYSRYAISKAPAGDDLSFIRSILHNLPHGARIVVHCKDGNRAAGAICTWLVLDRGMEIEKAIRVCRQAGMVLPETEQAVRTYLKAQARS
jgi:protein tyrosine phosphatase (PTP) superfamily phosphohydrolase (DUF442 family)